MTSLMCQPTERLGTGEAESGRSFRELCDVSDGDSEEQVTSLSPQELELSMEVEHLVSLPTAVTNSGNYSSRPPSADPMNHAHHPSAASIDAAAERFITQQLSTVPSDLLLKASGVRNGLAGVWTRQVIPKGTRYGPFFGKWSSNLKDQNMAWEVVSARSDIHGWLDASEMGNWLRHIQLASSPSLGNLRHVLLAGQIFYESTREIDISEELLLTRKPVIDIDSSSSFCDRLQSSSPNEGCESINEDIEEDEDDEEEELNRHQCLQCDKTFPDYNQLDDHLINSHGFASGQFRCEYCSKSFAWKPNLIQHKTLHGEYKRYPCENCTKVFTDPAVLQKHIRTQHVGARAHACPECGKTFATSSGLKQHTHIHSSVKPFQCEVCFKAYTQFSNLCRHKRMHADCRLQIKCNKCGQAFSTVTSLAKHKRFCDTAPSLPLQHSHHNHLTDNKLHSSHFSMNNIQPPPSSSLMMYPRPHLPLLNHSLLSSYPMFQSFPSLVGGPQHPLLTSSLLLPFQGVNSSPREPLAVLPKIEKDRDERANFISRNSFTSSPCLEEIIKREQIQPKEIPHVTQSHSPKISLISPSKSRTPSPIKEENINITDDRNESPKSSDHQYKDQSTKISKEKKELPLDLTTRRKSGDSLDEETRPDSTDCHLKKSPEPKINSVPAEEVKVSEPKPRTEHPFFRITELLKVKDNLPSSSTPPTTVPTPQSYLDSHAKVSLAYPRPLHPPSLLDMYRNFDRSFDRTLIPSSLGHNRYPPVLPPFFHPSTLGNMNLGLSRASGLDMLKAQMNASTRPYAELGRPYDLMATHIHRSKDRYACKFCGKVFPRSANLTRHLRTHTGEQPYKCKYCERSFSISSNLQRHVRNIHNKEKPFKCPLCDRCFGQQTNLDRHLKKHEVEGPDLPDSPEAPDSSSAGNDTPSNFFSDEIRSFVDKVTDSTSDDLAVDGDDDESCLTLGKHSIDNVLEDCRDLEVTSKRLRVE